MLSHVSRLIVSVSVFVVLPLLALLPHDELRIHMWRNDGKKKLFKVSQKGIFLLFLYHRKERGRDGWKKKEEREKLLGGFEVTT
jgi:hypothetical protein